jgi:excisionase family DNA binding protein
MDEMLSIGEAARLMGVHENTLRDWDIEGKFTASRTVGGHRRYALADVRNYIDKLPPLGEIPKPESRKDYLQEIIDRWEPSPYVQGLEEDDKKTLSLLLDNVQNSHQNTLQYGATLSTDQILWLTQQGWIRSKFRKLISIQPMTGPTALVYRLTEAKNEHLSVESQAVAAKTRKLEFVGFPWAKFETVKEIYADALSMEIDNIIFGLLCEKNKLALEPLMDISPPHEILGVFDYIIGPTSLMDTVKLHNPKIETFNRMPIIDAETFAPLVVAGKYPINRFTTPFFCPYVLISECKTSWGFTAFTTRYGSLS